MLYTRFFGYTYICHLTDKPPRYFPFLLPCIVFCACQRAPSLIHQLRTCQITIRRVHKSNRVILLFFPCGSPSLWSRNIWIGAVAWGVDGAGVMGTNQSSKYTHIYIPPLCHFYLTKNPGRAGAGPGAATPKSGQLPPRFPRGGPPSDGALPRRYRRNKKKAERGVGGLGGVGLLLAI